MKKFRFLAFAAAGMLLAACSTNDTIADGGQDATKEGTGYLSVTINLPTTPATRALNDQYDDGLAAEYKVNNATLLLFHGSTEADATFWQAVPLSIPEIKDEDNDNITSTYNSVAKVDDSYTNNLWALVLVNTKGVFDLTKREFTGVGDKKLVLEKTKTKIADLQTAITGVSFMEEGFFMTNAVLANVEGGVSSPAPAAGNLSVLAKLNDNCIKDTEEEAKANPAGSIFVERAVAKATLSVAKNAETPSWTEGTGLSIKSVEWSLNNTEPTSYLVRNMFADGATTVADYMGYSSEAFSKPNYRFVGNVKLGTTSLQPAVNFYRTYWCVDPQYSADVTEMNKDITYGAATYKETVGVPQYCHENTFDVMHQTYRNTTRAVIKVTLNDDKTFYTVNGEDKIYSKASAESHIKTIVVNDAEVQAAIKAYLTEAGKDYKISTETFTWTFTEATKAGRYKLVSFELSDAVKNDKTNFKDGIENALTEKIVKDAVTTANEYVTVLQYTKGVMYYEARFQHFADNTTTANDLAPWNSWETTTPGKTAPAVGGVEEAYPDNTKGREANYLGRYGMVRNNWYDVTVNAFKKIGSPVEPTTTIEPEDPTNPDPDNPGGGDTPDDNVNSKYISVKVNVLSWAKRVQGWNF